METVRVPQMTPSEPAETLAMPVEIATELAKPTTMAMAAFNNTMIDAISVCQREWLSFLARRLQENLTMPARFASCQSMPMVHKVYVDYLNRTIDQYQEELQILGRKIERTDTEHAVRKAKGSNNGTLNS